MRMGQVFVSGAVEGPVDEAAVRRLIRHINAEPGAIYGRKGKHYLLDNLKRYNEAARYAPWVILIDLNRARYSRRREVRENMVPRSKSGRQVGPAYISRLIEFVDDTADGWRPDVAAKSSDSLDRCLKCLSRLLRGQS